MSHELVKKIMLGNYHKGGLKIAQVYRLQKDFFKLLQKEVVRFADEFTQLLGEGVIAIIQNVAQGLNIFEIIRRNGFSGIIPDHSAQFVRRMKGQAVIDTPQPFIFIQQTMPPFAVCIVHNRVEGGDAFDLQTVRFIQCEVMLLWIVIDENL